MKQRIAVDMDGVMADVVEQFFRYDEKDFGRRKTLEEANGRPEPEVFPKMREYVFTKGFFRTAPVMEGSKEVLFELNNKYEIFIVSAATEFPQSLSEKQAWLGEHFPFIQWQQIVFCGLKTIIDADIMIDDHFKNLDHFRNTTILFTQPHNLLQDVGRHKRVNSWKDIAGLFLQ
jgi:5'(3')-deoxyribonucleotidase